MRLVEAPARTKVTGVEAVTVIREPVPERERCSKKGKGRAEDLKEACRGRGEPNDGGLNSCQVEG